GPLHDRIDHAGDVVLAGTDSAERMLAVVATRDHPRDCREPTGACIVEELRVRHDVSELVVGVDRLEVGQGIPDLPGGDRLRLRRGDRLPGTAVRLGSQREGVAPDWAIAVRKGAAG